MQIKVSRKTKKRIIGNRIRKRDLRMMLKETTMGAPIKTMFETREFTPYGAFCPKCGEKKYYGTGNGTSYPEHWEHFYCMRCGFLVGMINNSPFIHALEVKEYNYQL